MHDTAVALPPTTVRWPIRLVVALVLAASAIVACSDDGDTADTPGDTVEGGPADDATRGDGRGDTSGETADVEPDGVQPVGVWDGLELTLQPIAVLVQPTSLTARDGSDDLWVTERNGRVRRIDRHIDPDGGTETLTLNPEPVLDLTDRVGTDGEGGLLGLAFSPDGRRMYLHYTDTEIDTVIVAFDMDGDVADATSGRVLLTIEQPYTNHNGGDLHVGPDGMLYTGLGDGGSGGDPEGNGQDPTTLLGTMLRIDPEPDGERPYTIPSDNPFVGTDTGRDEVWMWGLRNPWRFSFDRVTGDLWIADVGQSTLEEINYFAAGDGAGANLGWNLVEGDRSFAGDPPPDHVPPIHTYPHEGRCSVTGGYAYRGSFVPQLTGVYLFGDYCGRAVTGLARHVDGAVDVADLSLDRDVSQVISFGEDSDGEIYVLEQADGRISRIQPPDLDVRTEPAG